MMTEDRREQIYGPDRLDLCECGRAGMETSHEGNPYGHKISCPSVEAVMSQPSKITEAVNKGPSVVDQEPTDVDVPKKPDLCGTFAVYLLPDGTAGLVLAIEGQEEPRRQLLPKLVVDMVLYGRKPSMKDIAGLVGFGGKG